MVAIGIHREGVSRQVGSDEENHGVHDRGNGEGVGAGTEGSENSDSPRSGQDNRERLSQDEGGVRVNLSLALMVGGLLSLLFSGIVGDASTSGASLPVISWGVASFLAVVAGVLIAPGGTTSNAPAQESPQGRAGGE